ncbi:beta-lactamase family protein [Streptomyces mobaraensis NBRC 13819 = DSM 40847]|uniref:serine hydrolase domain-containing protein n=1 Tax=Streptomyces mobaraensis TaxID=35621 RepID=UPI0009972E41|nr:serine hydrolase domain-containing protein [Streptomyces mobaraensis]QTT72337.1 beta-lactamase family protein [Streptomyces mobaraensis NBRC 13819 = DSM 40847]
MNSSSATPSSPDFSASRASSKPFRRRRVIAGAALAGSLLLTAGAPAALAAADTGAAAAPAPARGPAVPPLDTQALRAAIAHLDDPQATAAQVRVEGSAGRWYGTSGVADLRTKRPVRQEDTFRIGSITKVFVATVVLQLAAEHKVDLDAPVQRYLPGVLPAGFPPITITQLLNHTSGLPAESGPDVPDLSTPEKVLQHRYDRWTPRRLVSLVSHGPMRFEPGTKQEYRGINYVLAAMVVEKVTGRSYGEEIGRRILRPLHLTRTSVPGNDPTIHGPHVHGYLAMSDGTLRDATEYDQTEAWGEGEMISTTGDLDRFLSALFSGRLLPAAQLERMFTLPPENVRMTDGGPARYSAGLQTVTVNGVTFWGKTGERYGYNSAMVATRDQQRRLVYSFNPTHRDQTQMKMTLRIADAVTKGKD